MIPESVKRHWDDCNIDMQASLIAYSQIRGYEEAEELNNLHKMIAAALGA